MMGDGGVVERAGIGTLDQALADVLMQPGPFEWADAVEHDVAGDLVRELQGRHGVAGRQEAGRDQIVASCRDLVDVVGAAGSEEGRVDVATDHCGQSEEPGVGGRQGPHAVRDPLADGRRDVGRIDRRRLSASGSCDLADVQRQTAGAVVDLLGESSTRWDVRAVDERLDIVDGQGIEPDRLRRHDPLDRTDRCVVVVAGGTTRCDHEERPGGAVERFFEEGE